MIHNIDYHFHPNLPKSRKQALKKCQKFWETFQKKNINTVIITEHNFKNPKRAYELMKETKPADCYVFPGMEHVTAEGIDVLIFHHSESLYQCQALRPFGCGLEETIEIAEKHDFACCLAHPHSLAKSSIIKRLGHEKYFEYLNKISAVEITNASFDNLIKLFEKPILKRIFKKNIAKIYKTKYLPESDYPENVKFLAVGSDAHHPKQIGTYCTIEVTNDDLYQQIISNINPFITERICKKIDIRILLISGYITFFESMHKYRIIIFKKVKNLRWKTSS